MDNSILQMLKDASKKYGIPTAILYSIVMTESGGDSSKRTLTSQEDSRGLFQVNVYANPSANSSQLYNPAYNINYQVPNLVNTYNQGVKQGLTGSSLAQYVEQYGQKPEWNNTVASNISKYYNQYASGSPLTPVLDNNPQDSVGSDESGVFGNSPYVPSTGGGFLDTILNDVKFGFTYFILFVILIFSAYMVFVYKGGN